MKSEDASLILIVYDVIGVPFSTGATHVITTVLVEIVDIGATGISGMYPHKMTKELVNSLKPTAFYASI